MDGEVRSPPQSEHVLAGSAIIGTAFPRAPAWDRFSDLLVEKLTGIPFFVMGFHEVISEEKRRNLGDWSTTGVQLGGGRCS